MMLSAGRSKGRDEDGCMTRFRSGASVMHLSNETSGWMEIKSCKAGAIIYEYSSSDAAMLTVVGAIAVNALSASSYDSRILSAYWQSLICRLLMGLLMLSWYLAPWKN